MIRFIMRLLLTLMWLVACGPCLAQSGAARLTLDPASPVPMRDTVSRMLSFTDGNTPPVSLTGLAGNSIHDVYKAQGGLCIGPAWQGNTPPIADHYPDVSNAAALVCNDGTQCDPLACIYLGSIMIDPAGGQVTCHVSYGQARRCGVWNFWNPRPFGLRAGDPAYAWMPAYQPQWGPIFGDANNSLIVFVGRPTFVSAQFEIQNWVQTFSGFSAQEFIGIGLDSTSQPSGFQGGHDTEGLSAGGYVAIGGNKFARLDVILQGAHMLTALFKSQAVPPNCVTNQASCIYLAKQEANMLLTATYPF